MPQTRIFNADVPTIADLNTGTATVAQVATAVNAILAQLRKTGQVK